MSDRDPQPMHDPTSGCVIRNNGQVDNTHVLHSELPQVGVSIQSERDTGIVRQADVPRYNERISRFRVSTTTLSASVLHAPPDAAIAERTVTSAGLASYLWNGFVVGPHTIACDVQLQAAGCTMPIAAAGPRVRESKVSELSGS